MATNFPTSLDSLTNPASSDQLNVPSHSLQHANANDAIEALETKVGINNSGGTTSLDYRVRQLETNPTYTNEEAVDAVASALAAGTHSNITINYNDAGNSISISAAAGYTNEEAVDAVAAALTQSSGISIVYNDSANTITISVDSSVVLKTGATMTGALTLSGAPTSNLHAATKAYVDTATATVTSNSTTTYIPLSSIGVADGVASLNSSGVIPDAQIPAAIARDSEVSSAISTEVTNRNSAISTAVNNLINSAPGTLDTLGEIATALAADESAAASLTTLVNTKAPIASPTFTGTVSGITKSMVGLANVDNTTDALKPISTATQTALDLKLASATAATTYETITNVALKAPIASPTFTGTVSGVTKSMVGLGNVDNTTDAGKPVSTATQTALDLKSPIASPTFTGTVAGITKSMVGLGSVDNTADTAKPVSTTQQTALDLKANLASPTFTGAPLAPTATAGTNTTQLATTAFVKTEITNSVQPGAVYQTSAPASPAVGQIWIDSDEDVTTFDSNIFNRQSFTATASQTVFTSSVPFIEGYEQVYFNGLMLSRSADYTTSGSNTVTLASGAAVNDIIEIVTITALNAYVASQPVSISANTNLAVSKRYFVTSASALTLTLPANPSLNDQIDVVDASGNALTYNITIARNGKLINGLAVNLIIDTAGSFISLLYTGPTYGWRAQ